MHDWVALTSGEIPSPELVAAWVTLGMVPTERIPLWAAHWLVDGYDGQAVRALAGFSGTDPYEVHDTLPDALADCRTPIPDSDSAAAQTAFTKLARMHADGAAGEKWIIDKVDEILARTGYASSVISLPLGQLYGLDEEWGEGWGRTTQQLTAEVQRACAAQLAACSPAAAVLLEPDETTRP
ncbi:hypothetical protein ACFQ1S_16535 [Kibdelosporangium lantanae]|uniref:Uncharacterized protein n=1 Tax=Kibdelosporangium lantanae TaxID=1497396 RepID=A0ABW3MAL1_9PSEU